MHKSAARRIAAGCVLLLSSSTVARQRGGCVAEFRVTTPGGTRVGARRRPGTRIPTVVCLEGDPSCDADGVTGTDCAFDVAVCTVERDPGACARRPIRQGHVDARALRYERSFGRPHAGIPRIPIGTREATCGPIASATVPLFGTVRYGLRARGAGRLHRDALDLTCITTEQAARLDITVAGPGSDLDLAGIHDVPLPAGERIVAYLDQCDGPECRGALLFGAGTPNGDTLGPPLPIVAGGIGSCIVQWVREPAVAIRANVQTGTIDIPIDVLAYVFVTDPAHPCPRCVGYRCDGGPNAGGSCTVDGVVPVAGVPWQLSQDCPPGGEMAGSLELSGVLTTGTSSTPAMDDGCTTGRCAEGVCTGSACVTMAADPVSGEPICIDERGGLAQACCSSDTTRACFALIDGAVVRLGHAIPPSPAWPDPTFPKTTDCTPGSCTVLAGTFAITSTGNAPTARPGVAAVVVPVTTSWVRGTLPFP